MAYESKKEKISDWIEKGLIPKLPEKDFEYAEIVSGIAFELGVNEKSVEDVLQTFIRVGKIKHLNLLVATDEQQKAWNQKQEEIKAEADKLVDAVVGVPFEEEKKEEKDGKKP